MKIVEDDLSSAAVAELLGEHLADMAKHSPADSVHALDISKLRQPDVTFWCAWDNSELLGCGALKTLSKSHGEIKSMRTSSSHLGQGVAGAILSQLLEESVKRGYSRLSLETGSGPAFEPAHALYKKFGFHDCEPFGDYVLDPYSRFLTLEL